MTRRVAGRETGPIGLGCMGMTWAYGASDRDEAESIATIHRALGARRDPARHGRHVRAVHQRGAGRTGDRRAPGRGRAGHEVRPGGRGRRRVRARQGRPARARARGRRRFAAPAAHGLHRPLPAAPRGPRRAARGDLGRDGRARRAGQGRRARDVRGERRRARAGARDPPGRVRAVRRLAVDARGLRGGRALVRGARRRVPALRAAGPRLSDRQAGAAEVPARRLPQEQPALPARGDGRQLGARRARAGRRRPPRRHARAGRAGLAARAGRARGPDSGHQAPHAVGGERGRRGARRSAPRTWRSSTRSPPRSAPGTS